MSGSIHIHRGRRLFAVAVAVAALTGAAVDRGAGRNSTKIKPGSDAYPPRQAAGSASGPPI